MDFEEETVEKKPSKIVETFKFTYNFIRENILSIIFFGFLVGCMVLMVFSHEVVHQTIYKSYGIESHIGIYQYDDNWYSWTAMTVTEPYIEGMCNDSCELAHNINEAISYVLIPAVCLIGFGLFIIIVILEVLMQNAGLKNGIK